MRTYKLVNNLTGWFVFLIAAFTYCATIECDTFFVDHSQVFKLRLEQLEFLA